MTIKDDTKEMIISAANSCKIRMGSTRSSYNDNEFGHADRKFFTIIKCKTLIFFELDNVRNAFGGLTREYTTKTEQFCRIIGTERYDDVAVEAGIDHYSVSWDDDEDRMALRISSESLKSLMFFLIGTFPNIKLFYDPEILGHIVGKIVEKHGLAVFDITAKDMEME